jgi:outer membrane lipase/esterase
MHHKVVVLASAIAWALAASAAVQAREFSNLYVFGDSLSDGGTFAGALGAPASVAKFTTNPDNIWVQNLAPRYGLSTGTAWSSSGGRYTANTTGNNFAIGGARADLQPGVLSGGLAPMAASLPSVSAQVTSFLSRGAADGKALYAVWVGANDAFTQLGAVSAAVLTPTAALGHMQTAAAATATQVARLRGAGAKHIVVIGVPSIGSTPYGASLGASGAALIDSMVSTYNSTLKAAVSGTGVLYLDAVAAVTAIQANPTRFGITNTTIPACGTTSALGCVPGTSAGTMSAAQAATVMFADGVHPSGITHRLVSDWIYSTLESTSRLSLMSSVPMGRSGAQWRSIDNRLREFQNFSYTGQGLFITGDYAPSKLDATADRASASGDGSNLTIGYEKALRADLFGGAALGYGRNAFDLGDNVGSIKYNEVSVSGFLSKKYGAWYANAIATVSTLSFKTRRTTLLGNASSTDTGSTSGHQRGIKLQGGYNMTSGSLIHGPLAGLAHETVSVRAFAETTSNFTAMQFGEQRREQLRSRLGYQWQNSTELGAMRFKPYAQISHEYQHLADNRDYTAGAVGSTAAMNVATANRKGGYGLLVAGGTLEVSKSLNLGFGASATLGQPGARNSSFNLTLSAPL